MNDKKLEHWEFLLKFLYAAVQDHNLDLHECYFYKLLKFYEDNVEIFDEKK